MLILSQDIFKSKVTHHFPSVNLKNKLNDSLINLQIYFETRLKV